MEQAVQTLISPDNHWALLAILFAATSLAIWLEQKYKWASKISGAIITLVIAIALVNLRVIPDSAPVFDDIVWGYAVPLAIPLLLLQTNIRKIWKETGRFLLIFLIGAAGTVVGTILATLLLGGAVKGLPAIPADAALFADILARQVAAEGITVNNIAPGVFNTDRNRECLADPVYGPRVTAAIPMHDYAVPEDAAGTALLLASDAGRYITGATIAVDGGLSLPG